jgi:hypothetical protein
MRNLPIRDIGNHMEQQLEKLLRVTVFETDSRLKLQSPVDTGRFRVSWQIGQNAADGTPAPEGQYGTAITPPKGSNYQPGQEKLGNYYSVHNNLPYAVPLTVLGTSKQAPAGWVDRTAREMQNFVNVNYERIKRES